MPPQLQQIISRILSFPVHCPVVKFLTGLELLLEKSQVRQYAGLPRKSPLVRIPLVGGPPLVILAGNGHKSAKSPSRNAYGRHSPSRGGVPGVCPPRENISTGARNSKLQTHEWETFEIGRFSAINLQNFDDFRSFFPSNVARFSPKNRDFSIHCCG